MNLTKRNRCRLCNTEPMPFVLGILLVIVSVVFASAGIKEHQEYLTVKENLISIPAKVSKISVFEDSDGMDSYTACVTYTYEYKTYRDKVWQGMRRGEYSVGQSVEITINPDAPDRPYTYTGDYTGLVAGTIAFLACGCGMIRFSFHQKKE